MSQICFIPAKGSSRRIPNKNRRMFHGKPILAYSIETAKASNLFESIIVSTDDGEIQEIAQQYGADVMRRGAEWAREEIGPLDVARHCISLMDYVETVCVIYATAPLLSVTDLVRGKFEVIRRGMAYAVSVGTQPFLHDAAQFVWCRAWALRECFPEFAERTVMIPIEPERDCDINSPEDWDRALAMYDALHGVISESGI